MLAVQRQQGYPVSRFTPNRPGSRSPVCAGQHSLLFKVISRPPPLPRKQQRQFDQLQVKYGNLQAEQGGKLSSEQFRAMMQEYRAFRGKRPDHPRFPCPPGHRIHQDGQGLKFVPISDDDPSDDDDS